MADSCERVVKAVEDYFGVWQFVDGQTVEEVVRAVLPQVAVLLREAQQSESGPVGYLGLGAAAADIESWLS